MQKALIIENANYLSKKRIIHQQKEQLSAILYQVN